MTYTYEDGNGGTLNGDVRLKCGCGRWVPNSTVHYDHTTKTVAVEGCCAPTTGCRKEPS